VTDVPDFVSITCGSRPKFASSPNVPSFSHAVHWHLYTSVDFWTSVFLALMFPFLLSTDGPFIVPLSGTVFSHRSQHPPGSTLTAPVFRDTIKLKHYTKGIRLCEVIHIHNLLVSSQENKITLGANA